MFIRNGFEINSVLIEPYEKYEYNMNLVLRDEKLSQILNENGFNLTVNYLKENYNFTEKDIEKKEPKMQFVNKNLEIPLNKGNTA
jgi:hypothetical protein